MLLESQHMINALFTYLIYSDFWQITHIETHTHNLDLSLLF